MTPIYRATELRAEGRLAATDLDLRAGDLTMLIGPNGAGKTTLLRAAAGISGGASAIAIDGVVLASMSPAQRTKALSFLAASRDIAWPLFARDYVALGQTGRRSDAAVESALEATSVLPFAGRRIDRLSTGERSRVMLARALVARPKVMLLDEPCSNLDPYWQVALTGMLAEQARAGSAVLMSVHDLDLALAHADRLIVMDAGKIVADGPAAIAGADDRISEIFAVERGQRGWRISPAADRRSSR